MIIESISNLKKHYITRTGDKPNVVCMSMEVFYEFKKEADPMLTHYIPAKHQRDLSIGDTIEGMSIAILEGTPGRELRVGRI